MAKRICVNCGRELGIFSGKVNITDGSICTSCLDGAGIDGLERPGMYTTDDVKALIAWRTPLIQTFSPTKKIGSYLQIDDIHKTFRVRGTIFEFSNLLSFDLLEDGETITRGGLGRAMAGGLLFGGVGAIVGGVTGGKKTRDICTSMVLKITLRNAHCSTVSIPFIRSGVKKKSLTYKQARSLARECMSYLEIIADTYRTEDATESRGSVADEILKFKHLLDAGIITQDEFDRKKGQLLDLL